MEDRASLFQTKEQQKHKCGHMKQHAMHSDEGPVLKKAGQMKLEELLAE